MLCGTFQSLVPHLVLARNAKVMQVVDIYHIGETVDHEHGAVRPRINIRLNLGFKPVKCALGPLGHPSLPVQY